MDTRTARETHARTIFPGMITYYPEPLVLASGEGAHVVDADGKRYLDFFGGILTVSVGHCHPAITERIVAQLGRLQHVSTLYLTEPALELAERLARITPGKLSKCYFTNSGTEADETAVLIARLYTGRQDIVALRHAYSGRSLLAMSLTAHAPWRAIPVPIGGIKHAHSPYCYRCALGLEYPSCGLRCAYDIEELIAWLNRDPTRTGDPDILVMGDLNAYAKEDPITKFKNASYTNLIESRIGANGARGRCSSCRPRAGAAGAHSPGVLAIARRGLRWVG